MQPGRIARIGLFCVLGALPARAATIQVTVEKLGYTPAEITAKVGDTIEWDNRDILQHTATASNGDWSVMLPPKKKGSIVVKKAGTFDYYCKFHPNMKAKLTVTP